MKWFGRKKEEEGNADEPVMKPTFVPMSHILRSVVYDAGFSDPEKVIDTMGLQRVSDEVAEMEQSASERRLDAIEPLGPFLAVTSMFLAKATVAYSTNDMEEMPDEVKDALNEQFQRLALGASVVAVASLLDLGLIKLNGEAIGVGPGALGDLNPEDIWGPK